MRNRNKCKIILLLLLAFYSSMGTISAQFVPNFAGNLQKYWWYRYTLVNDYMKLGKECGESLIGYRHYDKNCFGKDGKSIVDDKHLHFGDQTTFMGNYLLMLAAEHEMLKRSNLSTRRTEYELYLAMNAFNRLDLTAEEHCRDFTATQDCENIDPHSSSDPADVYANDLNGFFIRDDVPMYFEQDNDRHFNRPKVCKTIYGTNGDVIQRRDDNLEPDWNFQIPVPRYPVEMSIDQVASLYLGFSMIIKLLDPVVQYNGVPLKGMAEDALLRITRYCSRPGNHPWNQTWRIMNPTSGKLVYGTGLKDWANEYSAQNYELNTGAVAWAGAPGMRAGLIKTGASWDNTEHTQIMDMYASAQKYNLVYQSVRGVYKLKGFAGHSTLFPTSFATVANNWYAAAGIKNVTREFIWRFSANDKFRWPHLPLIYRILHGDKMFQPQDKPWKELSYQDLITMAPKCLIFNKGGKAIRDNSLDPDSKGSYSSWEWSSLNRLSEAFKRGLPGNGDYPGTSYCALFGLYKLNEPNWGNEIGGFNNPYYCEDFAASFPFFTFGTHAMPYTYNTLEYLSTKSKIRSNGNVKFRNAKVIDLLPGFEAAYGSNFQTQIEDYSCSDCKGVRDTDIGDEFRRKGESEDDDFVMDTLFMSPMEPYPIPEPEEEQYELSDDEVTQDSLDLMNEIYETGDEHAFAYLEYLQSLEEGETGEAGRPAKDQTLSKQQKKTNTVIGVFPNPSPGTFNIQTTEPNYSISVYDVIGRQVYHKNGLSGNSGFDLTGKAKGLYLLRINSESGAILRSLKLTLE